MTKYGVAFSGDDGITSPCTSPPRPGVDASEYVTARHHRDGATATLGFSAGQIGGVITESAP